jgi:tRNA 2-thiouridine synthesizing protein B
MAILHIINKLNKSNDSLAKTIAQEDSILLIEDALFMLRSHIEFIKQLAKKYKIYGIKQDAEARAVANITTDVKLIDYHEFVTLTENHNKTLSWY